MATVGTKEDNQSAEIDQWLISINNSSYETKRKTRIDKVPTRLRTNTSFKNCCDPLVVSIGPYHFGNSELKEFEQLKIPIAMNFCRKFRDQVFTEQFHDQVFTEQFHDQEYIKQFVFMKQLYNEVAKVGDNARKCYAEGSTGDFTNERFNRIMFLDAIFVLHFMFLSLPKNVSDVEDKVQAAINARLQRSFYLVLRDLFLLENQIPLLVLKVLMKSMFKEGEKMLDDFIEDFLQLSTIKPPPRNSCTNIVKKFLEKMTGRSSKSEQEKEQPDSDGSSKSVQEKEQPDSDGSSKSEKEQADSDESPVHLLQLVREKLIRPIFTHELRNLVAFINESDVRESYRSVTDLKSAGIYFEPSQTGNLNDVEFKPRLTFGILTLPSIKVDHLTKPLLLNLVAYETCPDGPPDLLITSYICLMDSLIDDADDVKELRKKRILTNKLGSDEQLANLFNGIANDLVPDPLAYFDAKSKIDKHCKYKGHIWMAEWKHKYFSSPWTLLAFLGAIFVLALTMAQTYFAAYPREASE